MGAIVYRIGGYDPAHPANNMAEWWDDATATYTVYNPDGTVATSRPYTADEQAAANAEAAALAAATTRPTVAANIQTRQAQIKNWIAANPNGAVLTAAQTLVLAEMLNGIGDVLLDLIGAVELSSSTGT